MQSELLEMLLMRQRDDGMIIARKYISALIALWTLHCWLSVLYFYITVNVGQSKSWGLETACASGGFCM